MWYEQLVPILVLGFGLWALFISYMYGCTSISYEGSPKAATYGKAICTMLFKRYPNNQRLRMALAKMQIIEVSISFVLVIL
jgi:hypothetical protein